MKTYWALVQMIFESAPLQISPRLFNMIISKAPASFASSFSSKMLRLLIELIEMFSHWAEALVDPVPLEKPLIVGRDFGRFTRDKFTIEVNAGHMG